MNNNLLKFAFVAPAAMATGCCGSSDAPKQPNVIVILADDMGYGDMSAYGSKAIQTPNLDNLANNGVRFTDGHSTSATSTPSRYAMFTGSYPWRNPKARILAGDAPLLISVDQFTMPKMFKAKGYKTAAIGKWHLGMGDGNVNWNQRVTPGANEIGFDYSCLIAATNDRVPTVYVENGTVVGLDPNDPIEVNYKKNFEGQPTGKDNPELLKMHWAHGHNQTIVNGIPRIGYMKGGEKAKWVDEDMADYFVDKVTNYVAENKNEPFFLYFGLHQPHVPRTPHSRFVGKTKLGPRGDAMVEADWCVGELVKALEKEGILENTIIVYSSDNGPVLNDGYKDLAIELNGDHKPAGVLRGGKYSLYEAGTRVPFFTYWKGKIQPKVSDALVSQMDLIAWFADILDYQLPSGLDAENTSSAFTGESTQGRKDYFMEAGSRIAYREGDYVLIPQYFGNPTNETGNDLGVLPEFSLFDLSDDVTQEEKVTDKPEILEKMKQTFLTETKGFYNPGMAPQKLE